MKIAFWGLKPPKQVKNAETEPSANTDLLIAKVKTAKDLEKVEAISPKKIIVILASKNSSALLKTIAKKPNISQVWMEELWETQLQMFLRDLMQQPGHYEELFQASNELIEKFEQNIELASHIQKILLPQNIVEIPGIIANVKYIPASGAGGDYYDLFELEDKRRIGILLADSDTHGTAAALLSILLKIRLDEVKGKFPQAHQFLNHIQEELSRIHQANLAALNLFYGIIDRATLSFQYCSAGSIEPLILRDEKWLKFDAATYPPIKDSKSAFKDSTVGLLPGDELILSTQGVHKILKNGPNEFFRKSLTGKKSKAANHGRALINDFMAEWHQSKSKTAPANDMTLMHLQVEKSALYLRSRA